MVTWSSLGWYFQSNTKMAIALKVWCLFLAQSKTKPLVSYYSEIVEWLVYFLKVHSYNLPWLIQLLIQKSSIYPVGAIKNWHVSVKRKWRKLCHYSGEGDGFPYWSWWEMEKYESSNCIKLINMLWVTVRLCAPYCAAFFVFYLTGFSEILLWGNEAGGVNVGVFQVCHLTIKKRFLEFLYAWVCSWKYGILVTNKTKTFVLFLFLRNYIIKIQIKSIEAKSELRLWSQLTVLWLRWMVRVTLWKNGTFVDNFFLVVFLTISFLKLLLCSWTQFVSCCDGSEQLYMRHWHWQEFYYSYIFFQYAIFFH